jgi:hypothetical protein
LRRLPPLGVPPIELDSFGHARAGADQKDQQRPQMRSRGGDQMLDLIGQKKAGAAGVFGRRGDVRRVAPPELLVRVVQDCPHRHDDGACIGARRRVRAQHLALQLDRLFLIDRRQRDIAHRPQQAIDAGFVVSLRGSASR